MAVTYFGHAISPADAGSNTATPVAVTPPASMTAGDLVVFWGNSASTAITIAISEAGGQTWNSLDGYAGTDMQHRVFWCTYNGTWSADPSISFTGAAVARSGYMIVARPTETDYTWDIDVAISNASTTAASPHTITGITRNTDGAIALCGWAISDNNGLATLSGTGWTRIGTGGGYQNNGGITTVMESGYNIGNGGTNNPAITDNGPDDGTTWIAAWKEVAPAGGSLVKTKKGLAIASVKTMKGLAIASVKTAKGLTNV